MNFNHLLDERQQRARCRGNNNECYWLPVGDGTATAGKNVNITMYCKRCQSREDIFLTESEYDIHRKLIEKEIGNV